MEVPAGRVPPGASRPGLQSAVFCPHLVLSLCVCAPAHPFSRDPSHTELGPTLMASLYYLLVLKYVLIFNIF